MVVILPELLGTYGDQGNAVVLGGRALRRGLPVEVVDVRSGSTVPEHGDIYLLGGAEDAAQGAALHAVRGWSALHRAVAGGACVLGVCAGYQLLGTSMRTRSWSGAGGPGASTGGIGLLDVATDLLPARAVGEITVELSPALRLPGAAGPALPTLTGFENHGGRTTLGSEAAPLGQVTHGVGNGTVDRGEGAVRGHVIGTYLHGPVLARNPALADLLLSWAVGSAAGLAPLDDDLVDRLRRERLHDVRSGLGGRLRRRVRRPRP